MSPERESGLSRVTLILFFVMKLSIDNHIFNTDNCVKHRDCIKVTIEQVTPRVYVKKEELLCHQRQNTELYFNWVTVTKYIDGNPVSTYSWIQDVDEDELQAFQKIKETCPTYRRTRPDNKPRLTPEERLEHKRQSGREYYYKNRERLLQYKKDYAKRQKEDTNTAPDPTPEELDELKKQKNREYYQKHKEELLERRREYYQKNKNHYNNYSRKYYQDHKSAWKDKYVKPNKTD